MPLQQGQQLSMTNAALSCHFAICSRVLFYTLWHGCSSAGDQLAAACPHGRAQHHTTVAIFSKQTTATTYADVGWANSDNSAVCEQGSSMQAF